MGSLSGAITALQVSLGHGIAMKPVDPAVLIADSGLEGDRHAKAGSRRQVLLIEQETLDQLDLSPGIVKENISTSGIDLTSLPVDTHLALGPEVELWITGPCHPCGLMDEIRDGLRQELRGRRGVLAWVKRGGRVRIGDTIRVLDSSRSKEGAA